MNPHMSDVIITLWGNGNGSWLLTFEIDRNEATVNIGAAHASDMIEKLGIPFADPVVSTGLKNIKEAEVKAQAWLYHDLFNLWFVDILLPNGLAHTVNISNRIDKLLEIGIKTKPEILWPKR